MSTRLETLEAGILGLDPSERSHLLERLIASLDADPEIEAAWDEVAARREAEIASGAATAVHGEVALARLRARLSE